MTNVPAADVNIAVGVPAETIRRRPDVRSTERQLTAQAAQVNVTVGDLCPRFSLTGSIGLEALKVASLFAPGTTALWGGPSASWRLFDRRQFKQNVLVQQERETQAALACESTVLRALCETKDALVGLAQDQMTRAPRESVDAAGKAADLSLALYQSVSASVSLDIVRLYKAIGGEWTAASLQPAALAVSQ